MVDQLLAYCGSPSFLMKLVIFSDLLIAFAYFAIPISLAFVLRHRRDDIPYPWLWSLFVLFIVACGCTHLLHFWPALGFEVSLPWMGAVSLLAAVASVGTAMALVLVLPQVKHLPSPQQQKAMLE